MAPALIETGSLHNVVKLTDGNHTSDISLLKIPSEDGSKLLEIPHGTYLHFDSDLLPNQINLQLEKAPENEKAWEVALKAAKGISFSVGEIIDIKYDGIETSVKAREPVMRVLEWFLSLRKDGITLVPRTAEQGFHYNNNLLKESVTIPKDTKFVFPEIHPVV